MHIFVRFVKSSNGNQLICIFSLQSFHLLPGLSQFDKPPLNHMQVDGGESHLEGRGRLQSLLIKSTQTHTHTHTSGMLNAKHLTTNLLKVEL